MAFTAQLHAPACTHSFRLASFRTVTGHHSGRRASPDLSPQASPAGRQAWAFPQYRALGVRPGLHHWRATPGWDQGRQSSLGWGGRAWGRAGRPGRANPAGPGLGLPGLQVRDSGFRAFGHLGSGRRRDVRSLYAVRSPRTCVTVSVTGFHIWFTIRYSVGHRYATMAITPGQQQFSAISLSLFTGSISATSDHFNTGFINRSIAAQFASCTNAGSYRPITAFAQFATDPYTAFSPRHHYRQRTGIINNRSTATLQAGITNCRHNIAHRSAIATTPPTALATVRRLRSTATTTGCYRPLYWAATPFIAAGHSTLRPQRSIQFHNNKFTTGRFRHNNSSAFPLIIRPTPPLRSTASAASHLARASGISHFWHRRAPGGHRPAASSGQPLTAASRALHHIPALSASQPSASTSAGAASAASARHSGDPPARPGGAPFTFHRVNHYLSYSRPGDQVRFRVILSLIIRRSRSRPDYCRIRRQRR